MDPSRDHRISVHEDQAFFREAVLFTAGQTGLNATLIEKDYFCTVLLHYLYGQPASRTAHSSSGEAPASARSMPIFTDSAKTSIS
jgi:hypothetical protein